MDQFRTPRYRRKVSRPPSLKKPPSVPLGPKWEQELRVKSKLVSGPGRPPLGFTSGRTSNLEWIVYWALFKILAPNRDPRQPPFWGVDGMFRYQSNYFGGRVRGGTVLDFLVEYTPKTRTSVGIRVNGSRYHEQGNARRQAEDAALRNRLSGTMIVVDIWDYELLESSGTPGDGQKAVVAVKRAIGMLPAASRLALGTSRDVRYRERGA